jgi:predicted Zn-dependent protease
VRHQGEGKKDAKAAWDAACTNPSKETIGKASDAQKALLHAYKDTVFAHELLGKIYAEMGSHLEASRHYKKALLYRQLDPLSASPLLMDAYREACKRVKAN